MRLKSFVFNHFTSCINFISLSFFYPIIVKYFFYVSYSIRSNKFLFDNLFLFTIFNYS